MLFRKKIDRLCAYCAHAGKVDMETCVCKKKDWFLPSTTAASLNMIR